MDFLLLKILLIIIMGIVPLVFGLLPIKLFSYLNQFENDSTNKYRRSSILISILSCFAGGVILGVAFIEMLPEARADMAHLSETNPFFDKYPFVELFVGLGIFLVYFVEEFIGLFNNNDTVEQSQHSLPISNQKVHIFEATKKNSAFKNLPTSTLHSATVMNTHGHCCHKISNLDVQEVGKTTNYHSITEKTLTTDSLNDNLSPTYLSISDSDSQKSECSTIKHKAITSAFTFVLALLVHTSLEGFAFGLQKNYIGMTSLFFGIIIHKALIAFSVGMNLLQVFPSNLKLVVTLIGLISLFSPIGAILGIIIETVNIHSDAKGIVTIILTCLSIGTFFYIAFFEILSPEREKPYPKLLQWFGCTFGYVLMAVVMSFAQHNHTHEAEEIHEH